MGKIIIEIDDKIKKKFKVKVAKQGKTQKEILIKLIKDYIA